MTCYDDIPRDLQLQILKKLDMESRIKCGIIGKLRVPTTLSNAVSSREIKKKADLLTLVQFTKTNVVDDLNHGDHVQLHPDFHDLYGRQVEIVDGPYDVPYVGRIYTIRFLDIPANNRVRYYFLFRDQYIPFDPDAAWYSVTHM